MEGSSSDKLTNHFPMFSAHTLLHSLLVLGLKFFCKCILLKLPTSSTLCRLLSLLLYQYMAQCAV